jgi:hypothetical protein
MDRFYEESAAGLRAGYNRSRHAYETFATPDDTDIEEERDELTEPAHQPEPARAREGERAASDSTRRPK